MQIQRGMTAVCVLSALLGLGCIAGQPDGSEVSESHAMLTSGRVGNLSVALTNQSDWPTGYCTNVTVSNLGTTGVSTWSVGVDLKQSTLNQIWNAQSTASGTVLTFKPVSWNAAIAAGASTSFGFCATKAGTNFQPSLVSINGTPVGGGIDAGTVDSLQPVDLRKPLDTGAIDLACVPQTCAGAGATCGSIPNGCGGVLNCGSCTAPETCGGGGTPNKCGSPASLSATLTTQTTWPTGYCDNVTVKNASATSTTNWTVVIQLNDSTMNQIWSAQGTAAAGQLSAKSLSWNGKIAPNATTSFGFCATKTGTNPTPAVVSVAGTFETPDAGLKPDAPMVPDSSPALDVGSLQLDTSPTVDLAQPDAPSDVPLPGTVTTTLAVQTTWETGYCMNATVKNGKSVGISTWTVVINLNQSTFSQIWNGQQTMSGSQMTVKPVSWNAAIPANGTAAFGFCSTKTGTNFTPTVVSTTGS